MMGKRIELGNRAEDGEEGWRREVQRRSGKAEEEGVRWRRKMV